MMEVTEMLRRIAIMLTITLSILCLTSGPASADKLVLFKNGKAMRVKTVTSDGQWLKCEFEDKNFLSVRASSVLGVEDAVLGSQTGELRPNQVAVGVGGGAFNPGPAGIGAGGPPPEVAQSADEAQDQADLQAAIAEEQAARNGQPQVQQGQQFGVNNGFGRRASRIGGQPQANPFQPGGLQPLNQNGSVVFPNRGLTQRGRTTVPGGPIRATQPNMNSNQNQNPDN
jgi:hypothetical protein